MNYKVDWWDNFNEELYCNYLIQKDEQMFTYKITYKYYKGNNEQAEMCIAIKYVQADDRQEAIKVFGMWEKLILKIEKV
jgi:hypothetical protein|tara:strand:- start:289 stop:525 length:237 start_codon:yes stop_codon:yes gene_type:complete